MTASPPKKDALRDEDPILLDRDYRATAVPRVRHDPGVAEAPPPQADPATPPAFWQSTLDGTETVRWFGAPDPVKADRQRVPGGGVVQYSLCGVGVVAGLGLTAQGGDVAGIRILGMALLILSGAQIARILTFGAKRLRDQYYLITDRAIYIAAVRPGDQTHIDRYPITARMPVTCSDDAVRFTVGKRQRKDRPDLPIRVSFYHIKDPAGVRALVRDIQKRMT
ncbi:MAG TPA: hypothetical protein VGC31_06615 [Paenirhodobacter sp.]